MSSPPESGRGSPMSELRQTLRTWKHSLSRKSSTKSKRRQNSDPVKSPSEAESDMTEQPVVTSVPATTTNGRHGAASTNTTNGHSAIKTSNSSAPERGGDATTNTTTLVIETEPPSQQESLIIEASQVANEVQIRSIQRQSTNNSAIILGDASIVLASLEPGALAVVDAAVAGALSERTERTRITSRNDGGRGFEREFLHRKCHCQGDFHICGGSEADDDGSLALELPQDERQPILPIIRKALSQALVHSAYGTHNYFIPCTKIAQIIRPESVSRLLREQLPAATIIPLPGSRGAGGGGDDDDNNAWKELALRICPHIDGDDLPSYQRILAILCRIKKPDRIMDFVRLGVDDSKLPLQYVEARGSSGLTLNEDRGVFLPLHDSWDKDDYMDFHRVQWQLLPAFFSVEGDKIVHYRFRPGEVLPFLFPEPGSFNSSADGNSPVMVSHGPVGHAQEEARSDAEGHFGKVFKYRLHNSQQDLKRYTTQGAERLVAVKLLKSNSWYEFEREYKMLVRLTPVKTPHLAKLLSTFEVPFGPHNSRSKQYYLMFECADSNLREFWQKQPPFLPRGDLAKWVAAQCRGLAEALERIHEFQYFREKDPLFDDLATHGFHGDLKPENILRYVNWEGQAHPLGVLQISDFGLSSFHHTATAQDIKAKMLAHPYRPPESQMVLPISQSLDTWTLGCLYLEFITWLVEGPEGLQRFEEARKSPGLLFESHVCFYEVNEKDGWTTVSIGDGVLNFVTELCKARNSSQFVCDFAELVMNQMLVIEDKGQMTSNRRSMSFSVGEKPIYPTNRIKASRLAKELERLIGKDDSYYTKTSKVPNLWKHHEQRNVIEVHATMKTLKAQARQKRRTLEGLLGAAVHIEHRIDEEHP